MTVCVEPSGATNDFLSCVISSSGMADYRGRIFRNTSVVWPGCIFPQSVRSKGRSPIFLTARLRSSKTICAPDGFPF
jgi:hypothetical protein